MNFHNFFPKILFALKYIFGHILLIIFTCDFQKPAHTHEQCPEKIKGS